MLRLVKNAYFALAILIGLLIVLKSTDYYFPDFDRGFLIGKSGIFHVYRLFLYAHIIGAPVALIAGLFQFTFVKSIHHRRIGLIYVFSILILAGPGGLGMSFYAIGGTINQVNFSLLSVLWLLTTSLGYYHAKQKNFNKHKKMMTRSFILTNSAVLIRLFSYVNHQFLIFDFEVGYIIVSCISWLPILLTYEILQIKKLRKVELH